MDVIVLDGNQRSALATVRSLGARGLKVAVGEDVLPSLSSRSTYCSHGFCYPSPYTDSDGFLKTMGEISAQYRGATLFPMTDVTMSEVLRNKALFSSYVIVPYADYEKYATASDKIALFRLARALNIPIPKTLFSSDFSDLKDIILKSSQMGFPLVLKPASSRIYTAHGWIGAGVRYAKNLSELKNILGNEPFKSYPYLLQEKIEGPGVGIFLLIHNGSVLARFAHRRIREKPPSGGVSVLCQSINPPHAAINAAERLMKSIEWSGVAMVEFKWDARDNMPKLMEVNARFWGSLQLAISAGVDFPYLVYCLAKGEKVDLQKDYKVGIKSRWELGDLDHLLIRLRNKTAELSLPLGAPPKLTVLKEFIRDFLAPSVRHEVFRPNDPGPFLFEMRQYLKHIIH